MLPTAPRYPMTSPHTSIRTWSSLALRLGRMLDRRRFKLGLGSHWRRVGSRQRTRMSWIRFAQLGHFARLVVRENVPGDYAEFGVWRGGSLYLVASLWRSLHRDSALLGFDSFEGLPAPDPDRDAKALYQTQFDDTDFADVKAFFEDQELSRVRLVRGWFEDTIDQLDSHRLALCHIDADLHASVKLALEHSYDRLSPGGVIIFDDYRHPNCSGATIAVEEFFANRPEDVQQWPGVDYSGWIRKAP